MGKADHSDQQAKAAELVEEVGIQLRKARESNQLSIATAAASLHLPPRVIEALEGNDFAQFEPVYVRGYLRNYARLLGVKADPLVQAYNQTLIQEQAPAAHPVDPPARRGGYLLLAAVGLPLFLWLASKALQTADERLTPSTATSPGGASAAPLDAATSVPALALPGQTANQSPEPPKPSQNQPEQPAPAKLEQAEPTLAAANSLADPASQEPAKATATPPEPAASAAPPSAPIQTVGLGPDNIAIHLSASAWVSVRDQTGKRLVHEKLPAGAERSFQGHAPFAVVLGNSPATKIELNGQPYAPPKPKAGTVARFSLGGLNSKN